VPAARKRPGAWAVAAIAGAVSAAGLLLWIVLAGLLADGSTRDMLAVGLLAAAAFLGVRLLGASESRALASGLVFAVAAFAAARIQVIYEGPLDGPLGYSNAAGSLFMLGSVAAARWLVGARESAPRVVAAVMMILFASVPWMNGTLTATVLVCLLPLAVLAAYTGRSRLAVAMSAALLAVTLAATIGLGLLYKTGEPRSGPVASAVDENLSLRRVQLWNDALGYAARNPVAGIGPGRYPVVSEVSQRNYHSRWPHNEFLHVAAEAGLPALLLLLGVFASGFVLLWHAPDPRAAAIGAFALGAAGVHASVDTVFHYPAIPMMVAAIVASAIGFAPAPGQTRRSGRSTRNPNPLPRQP
jgi:O-antigen ligase